MTPNDEVKPLNLERPQRAQEAFAEYSAVERQRRETSGEAFDGALYDEAVALVLDKLQRLEEEGRA
jgi:hypothetical protein